MPEIRRPILAKGEEYVVPDKPSSGGGSKAMPRTFEEARAQLQKKLGKTLETFKELPKNFKLEGELVACARLHPAFTAKTYDPKEIVNSSIGLRSVGSRLFEQDLKDLPTTKDVKKLLVEGKTKIPSRLVFVQGQEAAFEALIRKLDQAESSQTDDFKREVISLETIDLLSQEEKAKSLLGNSKWQEGRVELVLHPSAHSEKEQLHFLESLFSDLPDGLEKIRSKSYDGGPTFISCRLTREHLTRLVRANPLRSAKALRFSGLSSLRASSGFPMPPPPSEGSPSIIKVGLLDGGIDPNHPYLAGHASEDSTLSVQTPKDPDCTAHGTAVAGALLYGALNNYSLEQPLPTPRVFVESFRMLPTEDPNDPDLYECIDLIERIVPERPDIQYFNLSFGPDGPIEDDSISRFTYSLDLLAHERGVGFCVAVGNDGEQGAEFGRIQSPSDMVNGLGIGAFSDATGAKEVASYSCTGPGREAAKAKPDLSAFGGCAQKPFHLLSSDFETKALWQGTSFATPLVTSLAAQSVGMLEEGNPLLTRVLLIHTAKHPENSYDVGLGHGAIVDDVSDLLSCDDDQVTILFNGKIQTKKAVKLPLLLPHEVLTEGKLGITWTIGILPETHSANAADYTNVCIEDTFYPNCNKRTLRSPKVKSQRQSTKTLDIIADADEIEQLYDKGWTVPDTPSTQSKRAYPTEIEQLSGMKWEPIVRKYLSVNHSSLNNPFLKLKATPRGNQDEIVNYSVAVTLRPTQTINLYQEVLQTHQALQPVRVRTENEIRIQS